MFCEGFYMLELNYENFYEDYFINKRIGREKFYNDNYPLIIERNLDCKKVLIKDFLNLLCNKRLKKDKPRIIIWGSKFERLMNEQSEYFNFYLITNSINEYRHFKNNKNCIIYFYHKWQALIDKGYNSRDLTYTQKAIDEVANYIKKNNIRLVVLGNDKLFIEKLLQYAAQQAGIEVVIIQHGIYNIDSFRVLDTSNTADHFLTWSEYVKETYQNYFKNLNNDVRVIGYPLEIRKLKWPEKQCVLFLGNQYSNFNKAEGDGYLAIAKIVHSICENKDIDFIYRKHPSEIISEDYNEIKNFISDNKNLMVDLQRATIVIGDVSSVMLEASLVERHVIQIIWSERSKVGQKDPMYSFTEKTDNSYDGIATAIDKCMNRLIPNKIDDYYLWVNKNIKEDVKNIFLELC